MHRENFDGFMENRFLSKKNLPNQDKFCDF